MNEKTAQLFANTICEELTHRGHAIKSCRVDIQSRGTSPLDDMAILEIVTDWGAFVSDTPLQRLRPDLFGCSVAYVLEGIEALAKVPI